MSTARDVLHQRVDALADSDVDAARRVLEGLAISANDEVSAADEQAIARSRAAIAAGAGTAGSEATERLRAKCG